MESKERNIPADDVKINLGNLMTSPEVSEKAGACLFNLIVYTHEPRRTAYFTAMVKKIRKQFPCRIIFITSNPVAKEDYFHVETLKESAGDESSSLCEHISIKTSGRDINRIHFLIFPLIVPDLPIYLLWGQDPTTEQTILPHLEGFSTRLIFDAEATSNLQQFSLNMLSRLHPSAIDFVDMNWARIGGWREVLAQIFDSKERFEQLASADNIEFSFNSRQNDLFLHPETQAIYLQAWLASRLKWEFSRAEKDNDVQILYYKVARREKEVRLSSKVDENFEGGEILSINVQGDNGYDCHIERIASDQVRVQASNQFQCELPFTLLMPTLRSGRNFMQEIFYQRMSSQYGPMLGLISLIRWGK